MSANLTLSGADRGRTPAAVARVAAPTGPALARTGLRRARR